MRQNHKRKFNKGFTKCSPALARDQRYNDRLTTLNDFCLSHSDEDLSDVEYNMEVCLMAWFKDLDSCGEGPTPNFCKWAELVSRWNPLFQYAPEELRRRTRVERHEWHLYELPDPFEET